METSNTLNELIASAFREIEIAAGRCDLPMVLSKCKNIQELMEMRKTVSLIESRIKSMETDVPATILGVGTVVADHKGGRVFAIEVTQGMINQNLLTLTDYTKRRMIEVGESLSIQSIPSGERFETRLLANGNKLRERGAIARFYQDAGIKAGEYVTLEEIAPQQWILRRSTEEESKGSSRAIIRDFIRTL